jgi:hypothetical protein
MRFTQAKSRFAVILSVGCLNLCHLFAHAEALNDSQCLPGQTSAFDARSAIEAAKAALARGEGTALEEEAKLREYNMTYPRYAQVCTTTQYVRRTGKFDKNGKEILDKGGNGGHLTVFLKGSCIDETSSYPLLKKCGPEVDLTDPDAGVGVSVNQIFSNVNWAAIPGRRMFYHGGLGSEEKLNNASYEAGVSRAAKSGWYKGIQIKDDVLAKHAERYKLTVAQLKLAENRGIYEEIIARESIGTDFAVTHARKAICIRVPLPEDRFDRMVAFMNERNTESQKKGYAWDGIYNNCSHLISNAFAATGMIGFKETHKPVTNKILNSGKKAWIAVKSGAQAVAGSMPDMSIPANNVMRLAEASFERDITSADKAFRNEDNRRTVLEEKPWLPTSHGAVFDIMDIRSADKNEMFVRGIDPVIAGDLVFKKMKKKMKGYTRSDDPKNLRYYDTEANLRKSIEDYDRTLKSRKPLNRTVAYDVRLEKFEPRFYQTVTELKKDAEAKLQRLLESRTVTKR